MKIRVVKRVLPKYEPEYTHRCILSDTSYEELIKLYRWLKNNKISYNDPLLSSSILIKEENIPLLLLKWA